MNSMNPGGPVFVSVEKKYETDIPLHAGTHALHFMPANSNITGIGVFRGKGQYTL